ncbi:MAG: DNA cytosine methyltransferase [Bacteroidales bacterium]|nr:DNA cytosine methyltransferase [Bacteroidales bacterium]
MDYKFKYIDLFSGIGGFRFAMDSVGGECVFSSEINEYCKNVYLKNFGDYPNGDITKIDENIIPDFDILCAGFPCQPFSICGKKLGFEDTRGTLFFDICRIIKTKKPRVVLLENVKHLIHHNNGSTFRTIINSLNGLGYNVSFKILNSKDFGVAQSRERIIIVATLNSTFDFDDVKTTSPVHIKDILDKDGNFEFLSKEEYTIIDKQYIKIQPTGLIFCGYRNKGTWKKGVRPNTEYLSRVHRQPNRIYSINGIHPTIPSQETSGRYWIYSPEEDTVRKLTLNECYKLMGFPENFVKDENKARAYLQCGNAVVIPMVKEIAKSIIRQQFDKHNYEKIRPVANNRQLVCNF